MTILFWLIVLVMMTTAILVVVHALRSGSDTSTPQRQTQNIQIARERLVELRQELAQGLLSQSDYEQARAELELTLLSDIEAEQAVQTPSVSQSNTAAWSVAVFVPVLSLILYFMLGQPETINTVTAQAGNRSAQHPQVGGQLPSVEELVGRLTKRLQSQPDDAEGWYMLGRTHLSLGNYAQAVQALSKANQLVPDDAQIMLRYADALTMTRNGKISGEPFDLIKRALILSPHEPTGLWLAGMGYEEQGDYSQAIAHWQRLLPLLEDQPSIQKIQTMIANAQQAAGQRPTSPEIKTQPVQIKVHVTLATEALNKVSGNDVVFIVARAEQGPPMPLAVVRKQVKDLPAEIVLDDSMAMMPNMKISDFDRIQLVARISKSGQATAQPGDWQSNILSMANTTTDVIKIVIDQQIP